MNKTLLKFGSVVLALTILFAVLPTIFISPILGTGVSIFCFILMYQFVSLCFRMIDEYGVDI